MQICNHTGLCSYSIIIKVGALLTSSRGQQILFILRKIGGWKEHFNTTKKLFFPSDCAPGYTVCHAGDVFVCISADVDDDCVADEQVYRRLVCSDVCTLPNALQAHQEV